MPLSVVPTSEPSGSPQHGTPEREPPTPPSEPERRPSVGGSRWIDYDTHELLEMISELEDERRWARLREGILWALLIHIAILSSITWIPRYIFHAPQVIDPFDAIKQRKDLKYLDLPPDLISKYQPKAEAKPVPKKMPQIDRKTLEALNKPPAPLPPVAEPKFTQPQPAPPPPIPPSSQSQSQLEAPQPKAVPARPNFAMGSQDPADQLRDAMGGASRNPGYAEAPSGGLSQHPGAGGGAQIISATQGVDFNSWLQRWYYETERTWDPLIPDEVNPPIYKQGQVQVRFKVAPNGRVIDGSMVLEGRSGDTALDRAAWGAITGSGYPPLPRAFHGPYIELRAVFMYNMRPPN